MIDHKTRAMILPACVFYPITGVLLLCTLSLSAGPTHGGGSSSSNGAVDMKQLSMSGGKDASLHAPTHGRPVAGGNDVFTSSFLVRFRNSVDNDFAHSVAQKYGFDNLGAVSAMLK